MRTIVSQVLLFLLFTGVHKISNCQIIGDSSVKKQIVFSLAEVAPAFPGGTKAFYAFVAENLVVPPGKKARARTVTARIVIGENGKIVYGEIEKGIDTTYNEAVLDLIKKMPDWTPAKQNGRNVSIWVSIPIVFTE